LFGSSGISEIVDDQTADVVQVNVKPDSMLPVYGARKFDPLLDRTSVNRAAEWSASAT